MEYKGRRVKKLSPKQIGIRIGVGIMKKIWSLALTAAMLLSLAAVGIGEISVGVQATEMSPLAEPAGLDALWGLPNGYILEDGSVLLLYGLGDLQGMLATARERNAEDGSFLFNAAAAAEIMPFESDDAKAEFIAKFEGALLVDAVYSKSQSAAYALTLGDAVEWPEDRDRMDVDGFIADSSVAYAVYTTEGIFDFVTLTKHDENFTIYVDTANSAENVNLDVSLVTETEIAEQSQNASAAAADDSAPDAEDKALAGAPSENDESAAEAPPVGDEPETDAPEYIEETPGAPEVSEEEPTAAPEAPAEPETSAEPEAPGVVETPEIPVPEVSSYIAPTAYYGDKLTVSRLTETDEPFFAAPEEPEADNTIEETDAEVAEDPAIIESAPRYTLEITPIAPEIALFVEQIPAIAEEVTLTVTNDGEGIVLGAKDEADKLFVIEVNVDERVFAEQLVAQYAPTNGHSNSITTNVSRLPVTLYDYENMAEGGYNTVANSNQNSFNWAAYDYTTNNNTVVYSNGVPSEFILFGGRWAFTDTGDNSNVKAKNGQGALSQVGGGYSIGDQNLSSSTVKSGIASSSLTLVDGVYEFASEYQTYNKLSLFPAAQNDNAKNALQTYIYGNNNKQGTQETTMRNNNTGMITAYYDYQFPFVLDADGYYNFDSDNYHVHFVQGTKNLNLYAGSQQDSSGNGSFFPFDSSDSAATNKFFGIRADYPFYIPSDGTFNDKDIVFEFKGDDDLWVYIDGELVLDIGGSHAAIEGSIDFAKNEVKINGVKDNTLSSAVAAVTKGANHTISIFYMERGGYQSNLKMKFNLPIYEAPEPGELNLYKIADDGTTDDFDFTVYTSTNAGNTPPQINDYPDTKTTYKIGNLKKQTIEIPEGGRWIRIVEDPVFVDGTGSEKYSTAYRGDHIEGVAQGRDSGWIWVSKPGENETPSIFCFNSTHHPVTVHKREASADQTSLAGATFTLYKNDSNNYATSVKEGLTSDANGVFVINDPAWTKDELQKMTEGDYKLTETDPPIGYVTGADIFFTLRKDNNNDLCVESITGGLAGKSVDGRDLYIYNKLDVGKITVTKSMAADTTNSTTAHGEVILLFTVEQFEMTDSAMNEPIATWAKELTYGWGENADNTVPFNDLPLGYKFRVTELNPARYATTDDDAYTQMVELSADDKEQTAEFENTKITEHYLSSTSVAVNTFLYPTPDWEPDDNELVLYKIEFFRGSTGINDKISESNSVPNGKINLVELGDLSSADMGALTEGRWQIQMNGTTSSFYPHTLITGNCKIIIPD
jgi:fibro-slime domain-containing protein